MSPDFFTDCIFTGLSYFFSWLFSFAPIDFCLTFQSDRLPANQREFGSGRLHAVWFHRRSVGSCYLLLRLCRIRLHCNHR